jgi:bifunctional UDP-N-acetylglucosamine pyrophosphorylase/glucosamine-1-phosphate N-acetyltransferase
VILQGTTVIGDGTEVGPNTRLVDTAVGAECVIEQTTARNATVGDRCTVGPYCSLPPGTEVPANTVTGPFYTADPGL